MSAQLPLQLTHALRYSSAAFVAHRGVSEVVQAVLTIAGGERFALVFIEGGKCAGKTHLAVFIAGSLSAQDRPVRVVSGAHIVSWFSEELLNNSLRPHEIVILDDADRALTAAAGTGLFGDLVERVRSVGGLLVLMSATPAASLSMDPYTRSRIEAGVNLFIGSPEESDLDALLKAIVCQRGILLSDAKRSFVLKRIPRTIQGLVEYVERFEQLSDNASLITEFGLLAEAVPGCPAAEKQEAEQ